MKKWYACEVSKDDYSKLRVFLKENNIRYEPSACGDLVHVEVFIDSREFEITERFLYSLQTQTTRKKYLNMKSDR